MIISSNSQYDRGDSELITAQIFITSLTFDRIRRVLGRAVGISNGYIYPYHRKGDELVPGRDR